MKRAIRRFIFSEKTRIGQFGLFIRRMITTTLIEAGIKLSQRRMSWRHAGENQRVMYVAASVLPYHTSGYTVRTHALVKALKQCGIDVVTSTRPGYPWDREDRQTEPSSDSSLHESVTYQHSKCSLNQRNLLHYLFFARRALFALAQKENIAVIQAASNHVNALPALMAAKQLGIPFVYEMRGLWELSRAARKPESLNSSTYKMGLQLERLVARHSDHIFVISEQLGDYIHHQFEIPRNRISLLPNCAETHSLDIAAEMRTSAPSNIIAYAGALLEYEGLDTLLHAAAILHAAGVSCKLQIAGSGEQQEMLQQLAITLKIEEDVEFMGSLTPPQAREMLVKSALVCIPRKPYEVCRVVPPIKLVEAMSLACPVVVPDLPVFRDELSDETAAYFFRSGDAEDLARVLQHALQCENDLRATGLRGHAYVSKHRNWIQNAHKIREVLTTLTTTESADGPLRHRNH